MWHVWERRAGHVACMGEKTGSRRVLVGKFEEKKPLGRPWRRRKDWIKMNLDGVMSWIDLAQNRDRWRALANAVMHLLFP